jgi:hypothetical protein
MACCALAAFVVSQLLVALDWARERFGLAAAAATASASAAWRLGDAVAPAPRARAALGGTRRLTLALGGGALAFAVSFGVLEARGEPRPHALQIPYLCTSGATLALE